MALTRKMLTALGLDAEKVDEVIMAHAETVNALKDQIEAEQKKANELKAEIEKYGNLQRENEDLKKRVEAQDGRERDYEALKKEYEEYKTRQEQIAERALKETAYKELLKDAGISEKHFAKILKYTDLDSVELGEDGKPVKAKELLKEIKEEWGDHIQKTQIEGAHTPKPPTARISRAGMTLEQIDAIEDTKERQKAMLENRELFGL